MGHLTCELCPREGMFWIRIKVWNGRGCGIWNLLSKNIWNQLSIAPGYTCTPPVGARQPEVLNVEVYWKKAEQNLLAIFQLDHDQLTSVLLSHLFWIFQPTFKLQLMILAVITMLWAFLNCFLLFLVIFLIKKLNTFTSACGASLYFDVIKWV